MKKKSSHAEAIHSYLHDIQPVYSLDEFKQVILTEQDIYLSDSLTQFKLQINHIPYFAPGKYMWYIVDKLTISAMGGMADYFTGYPESYWINKMPEEYFRLLHPDDLPFVMAYAEVVYKFILNIKADEKKFIRPSLYFRLKHIDTSDYRLVLFHYVDWIYGDDNRIASILHVLYDVSHINGDICSMLTILDARNEKSQLYFSHAPESTDSPLQRIAICKISDRERDILRLLARGFSSKQMANQLKITKNTVENHRQNLLKKTACTSSAAMVAYALKYGLF